MEKEADSIFTKVKEGIIKKTSIGYNISKAEIIRKKQTEEFDTMMARKWKPKEISLVVFPADKGAGIRSENQEPFEEFDKELFIRGEPDMTVAATAPKSNESENPQIDLENIRKEERKRIKQIDEAVRLAGLDEEISKRFIDEGTDMNLVREEIFL